MCTVAVTCTVSVPCTLAVTCTLTCPLAVTCAVTLGTDHPDTLTALNTVGLMLKNQKKLDRAAPLLEELLDARRRMVIGLSILSFLPLVSSLCVQCQRVTDRVLSFLLFFLLLSSLPVQCQLVLHSLLISLFAGSTVVMHRDNRGTSQKAHLMNHMTSHALLL